MSITNTQDYSKFLWRLKTSRTFWILAVVKKTETFASLRTLIKEDMTIASETQKEMLDVLDQVEKGKYIHLKYPNQGSFL